MDAQSECDWRQANSNLPCTPAWPDPRPAEQWCPVAMRGECPHKDD